MLDTLGNSNELLLEYLANPKGLSHKKRTRKGFRIEHSKLKMYTLF